jgi:hypothetical protein
MRWPGRPIPSSRGSGARAPAVSPHVAAGAAASNKSPTQIESPPKTGSLVIAGHRQHLPIQTTSFLKHRRFDPELIDSMSAAYASVCHAL